MEIVSAPDFAEYWLRFRERTRRVIVYIPPDELEWSPKRDKWTFGDIVRHLAGIERDMYAENVVGRQSRYPGHGRELADGYQSVLKYLDNKHAEAVGIFASLTPAQLHRKCTTPAGVEITTWKWLRAMVEHEAHHRGQLHLMLGLRGLTAPPLYGLTEEQVRERSV